jgi:hypothetical protein
LQPYPQSSTSGSIKSQPGFGSPANVPQFQTGNRAGYNGSYNNGSYNNSYQNSGAGSGS